jgi:cell division protein FtsB
MEDKIKELTEKVDKLTLTINELEKRIHELETGSLGTGVYLDGTPDYVKEYINREGE